MGHAFVYLEPGELEQLRDRSSSEPLLGDQIELLRRAAEALLSARPLTVVQKPSPGPSGDLSDFYAIGGYSWPNADSPDGLPYVYRDSQTNPEALQSERYDKGRYEEMTRRVATLSLAYFYSGDERFAGAAATQLRTWFIDSRTRMNPHFRFSAARPGVWDGHFSGVIEGVFLIELLDHVALLAGAESWTAEDDRALRGWFADLSSWLVRSRFGRRETFSRNNHGSYVLAQIAAFSIYGGRTDRASRAITLAKQEVRRQIESDGRMPHELDRADGWFYSIYGLRAFVVLARLASHLGEDLWRESNAAIAQSCSSLASYLTGLEPWPFTRGSKPWQRDAVQLFQVAGRGYGAPQYLEVARALIEQATEDLPHVRLLGGEVTDADPAGDVPVARLWTSASSSKPQNRERMDQLTARVLGVLAARGIWFGRRFP